MKHPIPSSTSTIPKNLETVHQNESVNVDQRTDEVLKFKRRMLEWPNPVEYVNNMYGCHPDSKDTDYFKEIFGK